MSVSPVKSLRASCVPLQDVFKVLKSVAEESATERVSGIHPPMAVRRWWLATAIAQGAALWGFMLETSRYAEASLFVLKGDAFPRLVPPEFHGGTLWYRRVPPVLEPRVEELASVQISSVVHFSKDLLHADVHAQFTVGALKARFVATGVEQSLPNIDDGELPCILILVGAGRSLVLSVYPVTVGVAIGLYGVGSCAGPNYRPYKLYTEEEINAAKERAKRERTVSPSALANGDVDLELKTWDCRAN